MAGDNRLVPFDRRQLKVNQVCVIGLLVVAFLAGGVGSLALPATVLVGLVGVVMLGGTLFTPLALFRHLYFGVLKPSGILKPDVIQDDPVPHRFANGLGGTFVLAGFLALAFGVPVAGWALAWIVIALAALNFAFDLCVGCIVFHQLERAHLVPGRPA
ncbi:MAG: DUF4395 domain-containing protein [Candidatus Dormibacteria bacterium]